MGAEGGGGRREGEAQGLSRMAVIVVGVRLHATLGHCFGGAGYALGSSTKTGTAWTCWGSVSGRLPLGALGDDWFVRGIASQASPRGSRRGADQVVPVLAHDGAVSPF